jgi:type IV pilus assembly protein PilA
MTRTWPAPGLDRPRPAEDADQGFTLIELLVVMIIIGILASIAIPVYLRQRQKAQDSATTADVSKMGKEVGTYFVDGAAAPTLTMAGGRYLLNGNDAGAVSQNVTFGTTASPAAAATTTGWTDTAWCISMTNPQGRQKDYKYSAKSGLEAGTCTSPTAP